MNLVLKLISSPWFWTDVVLSVSGGVLVYLGLRMEKAAEKKEYLGAFTDDVKLLKLKAQRGWRILMTGIVVEVVAALGISVISGLEVANLTDQAATAGLEAKQAENEAGQANERAAKFELAATELEQQIAETRTNVAQSDRSKWPVYSLTAEVRLRFNSQQELPDVLSFPARLSISQSNVSWKIVSLTSANATKTGENKVKRPPIMYLLVFSNPFRPGPIPIKVPLFGGDSAEVVANELNNASLQITNFPDSNPVVTSGSATITINDVIWKTFQINPGTMNNGFVTLTGAPSGSVKFLQPK